MDEPWEALITQPSQKYWRLTMMTRKKWAPPAILMTLAIFLGVSAVFADGAQGAGGGVIADKDVVIQVEEISSTAKFYQTSVEGTRMEVIAVKASDGSIRTAFNTCQVCYDSGRGYYIQDGSALVCQNCGNRFRMDQVEAVSGGCNPVPIFPEYKVVTDRTITIPYSFLKEAKVIFSNWRTEY
jgi:hypothetical protein